jgi:hypothetical protein
VSALTADPLKPRLQLGTDQDCAEEQPATWTEGEAGGEVRGPGPCRVASPVGSIDSYAQTTRFLGGNIPFAPVSSQAFTSIWLPALARRSTALGSNSSSYLLRLRLLRDLDANHDVLTAESKKLLSPCSDALTDDNTISKQRLACR